MVEQPHQQVLVEAVAVLVLLEKILQEQVFQVMVVMV
jgi:hypothetical protein